jgi:aminodeoxyfutalosine synthase
MAEDSKGLAGVTPTALDELAGRMHQGATFSESDAALILESHDLVAIGMISDEVRRQLHGADTTFVRVFEAHVDAAPEALPPDTAAGEFRIVGTPDSVDTACRAVARLRALAGPAPVFGFSLHELEALGTPADTFRRLKQAGLDGIAEVAVDHTASAESIAAARAHGLLVLRVTVHGAPSDLVTFLARSRDLLAKAGGFRAFAPLPRRLSVANPTTGYDDVKAVALARLWLRDVPSIQVDWPLYGPKLAQVALIVGADDVDGVSAAGAGALGTRRSPIEEINGNIRAAGLVPVERNGRFERIGHGTGGGAHA